MLEIRLAANKDVDYVILDVLIPLLDPLPPLVDVPEGRLVGDVIRNDDGMSTGVVKLSFDLFYIIAKYFYTNIIFLFTKGCESFLTSSVPVKYNLW